MLRCLIENLINLTTGFQCCEIATDAGISLLGDATYQVEHDEYGHHLVESTGNDQRQFGEGASDTIAVLIEDCLLYTSPSPRDATLSRMPSSA